MAPGLGIDAGGGSTRWLLLGPAGLVLGRGEGPPLTGHVGSPRARRDNLDRFRTVLAAAAELGKPDAVVAGITGVHGQTEAARLFESEAAGAFGLEASRVKVVNDMDIAYADVFAPGEGVLVYAGTGSVGYHLRQDGSVLSAGGYGLLVDDAGGGYWIGQQGLRHTLRLHDERGCPGDTPLALEIYRLLGSRSWADINQRLYKDGRSQVAALAPAVSLAAEQGDAAAASILRAAGAELARLARVMLARAGKALPVALAGGTTAAGPLLTEAFAAALPFGAPWHVARLDPAQAAARLARSPQRLLAHPRSRASP